MAVRHLACSVLVSLLSIAYAVAQITPADSGSIDREIQSGEAAIRQGRFGEAKRHFEQAESLGGPPSAEINAGIAVAELQTDHYEAARQREAKVLELVSTDHERAEAHNLIGTAWLRESAQGSANVDKLRAAEDSFQRAVKLDPVFDTAYFNLGKPCSVRTAKKRGWQRSRASSKLRRKTPPTGGTSPSLRKPARPCSPSPTVKAA